MKENFFIELQLLNVELQNKIIIICILKNSIITIIRQSNLRIDKRFE